MLAVRELETLGLSFSRASGVLHPAAPKAAIRQRAIKNGTLRFITLISPFDLSLEYTGVIQRRKASIRKLRNGCLSYLNR